MNLKTQAPLKNQREIWKKGGKRFSHDKCYGRLRLVMMEFKYIITPENRLSLCDEISDNIGDFCAKYLKETRDIMKYRLSAEECLLNWLTDDSVGKTLTVCGEKRRFMPPSFTVELTGEPCNPTKDRNTYTAGLLRALGIGPEYHYSNGKNILQFDVFGHPAGRVAAFALILAAAVLTGIIGNLIIHVNLRTSIIGTVLTPLYDMFLRLLSLAAGPMIFLSVTWGIYGIGDTAALGRTGKSVIGTYIRNTFIGCTAGLAFIPLFRLSHSDTTVAVSQASELVNMILDCVPKNIVEPFYTGNTLQIIFLALITGITMVYLGKKTTTIAKAVEEANLMVQRIMGVIIKCVPALIFIVIVRAFWSDSLNVLKESWKFILCLILGTAIISTVFVLAVSVKFRVNPLHFVKKCLPTFIIALLTASSAAAFEKTVSICNSELGVDKSVTDFGVPLGIVMHNPIAAFNNFLVVLFFSEVYGVECSIITFISALFCCSVLAVASPPISGGGLIVYTMLFMQFGIPLEGVAVISAIEAVTDYIITSTEMLCLFTGIVQAADKVEKLDCDVLRS